MFHRDVLVSCNFSCFAVVLHSNQQTDRSRYAYNSSLVQVESLSNGIQLAIDACYAVDAILKFKGIKSYTLKVALAGLIRSKLLQNCTVKTKFTPKINWYQIRWEY